MRFHTRSGFIVSAAAASLISSAVFAQISAPNASSSETNVTVAVPVVSPSNWMTQEAVGQWRASKMIGLGVYNSLSEKIGTISEVIVDRDGRFDAVVVETGGFLGLGERHVAVPSNQIEWSYQPVVSSGLGTPPTTARATSPSAPTAGDPRPYPDHALLNMSKDQLKAAPVFKFAR
jgi:sporulation protein YlmC with PRC-barrel domain